MSRRTLLSRRPLTVRCAPSGRRRHSSRPIAPRRAARAYAPSAAVRIALCSTTGRRLSPHPASSDQTPAEGTHDSLEYRIASTGREGCAFLRASQSARARVRSHPRPRHSPPSRQTATGSDPLLPEDRATRCRSRKRTTNLLQRRALRPVSPKLPSRPSY